MRRLKHQALLIALSCAVTLPAAAQSGSPTPTAAIAAESAFLEGVQLMKQADWVQAAQRFSDSQRLDPASGTLLNLGYCQTQLGKTASAWLTYRRARALAERSGKPAHAQLAREQGDKLEPSLPKLRFTLVGDRSRTKQLKLDDEELAQESWSLSVPVDPGPHRIAAVFDTGETWQTEVVAQPGQQSVVEVKVPEGEALPVAQSLTPSSAASGAKVSAAPATSSRAAPAAPASRASAWPLGLGLAGVGAVAAGGALFVSARVGYDAARHHCSADNVCPEPYYGRERAADTRAKVSFVLAGSGVLLVGAATLLHFRASHADEPRAQLSLALFGPRDFGAAYTRAF